MVNYADEFFSLNPKYRTKKRLKAMFQKVINDFADEVFEGVIRKEFYGTYKLVDLKKRFDEIRKEYNQINK